MFSRTLQRSVRLALCVTALLFITLIWHQEKAAAEANNPIKITLDLEDIELAVDPIIRPPGVTLVPFRALFEAFDMEVDWDPNQKIVTGKKEGLFITLTIGKSVASVNDKTFELEKAPEVIDGNTMVPLRFIAESTGALVFWDPYERIVSITSQQFLTDHNLTREQVEKAVNDYLAERKEEEDAKKAAEQKTSKPAKVVELNKLEGMFYGFRDDLGGYECGGICWDYYTFLPNNQVFIGTPKNGGPETISCATEECLKYSIEKGQLKLSNGKSLPIALSKAGFLTINNVKLDSVLPVSKQLRLDKTYKYIGYEGLVGITGFSSSWTYYLKLSKDGTYEISGSSIASIGANLPFGPTTDAVFTEDTLTGTYDISGNTITMKGKDGTTIKQLFFIHNDSVTDVQEDIQIGNKNYYYEK